MVLSDRTHIRSTTSIDGKGLPSRQARGIAKEKFRQLLEANPQRAGVLYEVDAFTDDKEIIFNSEREKNDPNTQSHEEIHWTISTKSHGENWQITLPFEESLAYAYGDFIALNSSKRYTKPSQIRERLALAKHSMRLMQCIDHSIRSAIYKSSLRVLYNDAEPGNKNLAWALDVASNLLFYRECFQIFEEHGVPRGIKILFDSNRIAAEKGLESAWIHVLCHLSASGEAQILRDSRVAGKPIIIRSPYAPDCEDKDIVLKEG